MASIDSPAAARRRLRLALRKARDASGLTQGEVAEALDWSVSKVNRIENGEVTVSLTDVRALLALLRVTDNAAVEELTSDARTARKRGWWDDPRYRANVTSASLQLIQYEAEATAIRTYQPTLIPGVLQTPEYASTILDFWTQLSPEARTVRREVRARRGKQLFDGPDGPTYLLILDESVVLRQPGGFSVMAAQLHSVLEATRNPKVHVRVIPLTEGGIYALQGDFIILDLSEDENAILYREAALTDNLTDAREIVDRYRQTFEQMWQLALTEDESKRLIGATAAAMLASLDRVRRHG